MIGLTAKSARRRGCSIAGGWCAGWRDAVNHHGSLVQQGFDEPRTGFLAAIGSVTRCRPFDDLAATRIYQSDARGIVRQDVPDAPERGESDQRDDEGDEPSDQRGTASK